MRTHAQYLKYQANYRKTHSRVEYDKQRYKNKAIRAIKLKQAIANGRRLMALIHTYFDNRCVECSATEVLELAHIKPTPLSGIDKRSQSQKYNDFINHPECYVLFCHDCHVRIGGPERKGFKYKPKRRVYG